VCCGTTKTYFLQGRKKWREEGRNGGRKEGSQKMSVKSSALFVEFCHFFPKKKNLIVNRGCGS
jgi:hypothetical protein